MLVKRLNKRIKTNNFFIYKNKGLDLVLLGKNNTSQDLEIYDKKNRDLVD